MEPAHALAGAGHADVVVVWAGTGGVFRAPDFSQALCGDRFSTGVGGSRRRVFLSLAVGGVAWNFCAVRGVCDDGAQRDVAFWNFCKVDCAGFSGNPAPVLCGGTCVGAFYSFPGVCGFRLRVHPRAAGALGNAGDFAAAQKQELQGAGAGAGAEKSGGFGRLPGGSGRTRCA